MKREMKSIWYFVGLMLLAMGIVVFLSCVYYYFVPERNSTVLNELHSDIWWGGDNYYCRRNFLFQQQEKNKKGDIRRLSDFHIDRIDRLFREKLGTDIKYLVFRSPGRINLNGLITFLELFISFNEFSPSA
jgi:hypothetical protein